MAEQIFKPGYYLAGEKKFKQAIEDGDYENAAALLEKFPTGRNADEEVQRAVALVQGYRHLARLLISNQPILRDIGEIRRQYEVLQARYDQLNKETDDLNKGLREEREASRELRQENTNLEGSLKEAQTDLSESDSSRQKAESALAFL
jgi:chromosome segregation ATPase